MTKYLIATIAGLLIFTSLSAAASPAPQGFAPTAREIQEDDVTFRYTSSDGTLDLKCAHVFDKPEAHDWDVWCGKGTPWLRQFRVHFLARYFENRAKQKSAFEILYWVIDRNQKQTQFSSTSSWLIFDNLSSLNTMSFNLGVENDYAYLTLEFKPRPMKQE